MVARLTPDQKVACSNHVGVMNFFSLFFAKNVNNVKLCFNIILVAYEANYFGCYMDCSNLIIM